MHQDSNMDESYKTAHPGAGVRKTRLLDAGKRRFTSYANHCHLILQQIAGQGSVERNNTRG
jgi:hypothetical protein